MQFFNRTKIAPSTVDEFNLTHKPSSLWMDSWRRLRRNSLAVLGLVIVIVYLLVCFGVRLLPFYSYETQVIDHQNLPPSLNSAGVEMLHHTLDYTHKVMASQGRTEMNASEKAQIQDLENHLQTRPEHQRHYWLGTDNLGRDFSARIVYGGQISMSIGIVGALAALLIGIIVGAISGYLGGWVDHVLMRIVDIIYSLPYMLLVIILMALFGKSMVNLFVAIALVSWLDVARVIRGQIMSLKQAEFVEAARSMGASPLRIIFRHLVPNSLGVLIVYLTLLIPRFIISESFLSFLGLGVSAPLASWGSLVSEGVKTMELYPWQVLVPAVSMTVFLFAINFLGDGLRDAFDPQSKNRG